MATAYATIRNSIEAKLRDSGNTYISPTELDADILTALWDIARYKKHIIKVVYQVESRTGTCDADSAGNLTDTANSQFVSATDVGKTIYNTTDKTWAEIVTVSSTSVVALSKDIMDDEEDYEMYNTGCSNSKQINVEDIEDAVGDNRGIVRLEYPIGTERNIDSVQGNIVTIGIDFTPSDTSATTADKDVFVWFSKRHKISQLTDFDGIVYGSGHSAGDKTLAIDNLTDAEVVEEDQEFTIASKREIYTVTALKTLTTGAWTTGGETIAFYPGLESDVADNVLMAFTDSTLTRRLETVLIEYVVALALENEANIHLPSISSGGTGTYRRYLEAGALRMAKVIKQLESMAEPEMAKVLPRT